MTGQLKDKVALITGGCSGLGAAAVDLFAREGARIVVADLDRETGERLQAGAPQTIRFVRCNVMRETDLQAAVAEAERAFGGLDVLFSNAGIGGTPAGIAEMNADDWDKVMAVSPRAVMLGAKHAVPLMRRRGGGSIINTSSIAGLRPGIAGPAYSVAKAAILFVTKAAALEFAADNIRVNAICPGVIPTPAIGMSLGLPRDQAERMLPRIREIFAGAQPLARAGDPADIARMVLFLASDASSFVTGQEIVVDGGALLTPPGAMEPARPDGVAAKLMALLKA